MNEDNLVYENIAIEPEITESNFKEYQVEFDKTCYYDIYYNGKKVGEVEMSGVPDNVSCDSAVAKANALDIYMKGMGLQKLTL